MTKLQDYKKEYDTLSEKCNLTGNEAMQAVKQNGYALQYVKEQTLELCMQAVKQDGYALRYVNSNMFKQEVTEITLGEIAEKFGVDVADIKIIK